jgi:hypothetical protein
MKRLLPFLFVSAVCFAGDLLITSDSDFKKADPDSLVSYEDARKTFDLSKEKERRDFEVFEQSFYSRTMLGMFDPFFRSTKLKKGDDWRKLWKSRQQEALEELKNDKFEQESLRQAFKKLADFFGPDEAMVLERIVRAKFGGDPVWVFLVNGGGADSLSRHLDAKGEASLSEKDVIAVRISDSKIISYCMAN